MTNELARALTDAVRFLHDHDDFLVVAHTNPDGDATASVLAMACILERLGKRYTLANEGETPRRYAFLPRADRIVNHGRHPLGRTYTAAIALDCADLERIGDVRNVLAPNAAVLNIDHHVTNTRYGSVNLVVPQDAATAQVVYRLAQAAGVALDAELATCLYAGILSDTGGFRYANTTAEALRVAGELVAAGVRPDVVAERILELLTEPQLRLLQRVLPSLERYGDGRIACLTVTLEDVAAAQATRGDLEGLVAYARNLEGVAVGVLFREDAPDAVKVSLRAREPVDVARIAQEFGGGGHVRAAGCTLRVPLDEAKRRVIARLERETEGLSLVP
ncbi:DHH family phosphoesterase [Calditerricola satsumensis]|uniref:DHH family phosphoesterase n=2 Tax=Calditerricola satsumensis TaxID=373054 RepID=A0A8J3FAX2_9BACI|nr:bifunctional oligoribonuclease/PAP phosphatase NrnA [Calditerricola satsumensis]GGJ99391.1 DHH family phosphoesterase [Calditerricola satsumensis]